MRVEGSGSSASIGFVLILALISFRLAVVYNASGFGRGAIGEKTVGVDLIGLDLWLRACAQRLRSRSFLHNERHCKRRNGYQVRGRP